MSGGERVPFLFYSAMVALRGNPCLFCILSGRRSFCNDLLCFLGGLGSLRQLNPKKDTEFRS